MWMFFWSRKPFLSSDVSVTSSSRLDWWLQSPAAVSGHPPFKTQPAALICSPASPDTSVALGAQLGKHSRVCWLSLCLSEESGLSPAAAAVRWVGGPDPLVLETEAWTSLSCCVDAVVRASSRAAKDISGCSEELYTSLAQDKDNIHGFIFKSNLYQN